MLCLVSKRAGLAVLKCQRFQYVRYACPSRALSACPCGDTYNQYSSLW
jgi:hypothetical protein